MRTSCADAARQRNARLTVPPGLKVADARTLCAHTALGCAGDVAKIPAANVPLAEDVYLQRMAKIPGKGWPLAEDVPTSQSRLCNSYQPHTVTVRASRAAVAPPHTYPSAPAIDPSRVSTIARGTPHAALDRTGSCTELLFLITSVILMSMAVAGAVALVGSHASVDTVHAGSPYVGGVPKAVGIPVALLPAHLFDFKHSVDSHASGGTTRFSGSPAADTLKMVNSCGHNHTTAVSGSSNGGVLEVISSHDLGGTMTIIGSPGDGVLEVSDLPDHGDTLTLIGSSDDDMLERISSPSCYGTMALVGSAGCRVRFAHNACAFCPYAFGCIFLH